MKYHQLLTEAQDTLRDYDLAPYGEHRLVNQLAELVVHFVMDNDQDIHDFDFTRFFLTLEYDWDKILNQEVSEHIDDSDNEHT